LISSEQDIDYNKLIINWAKYACLKVWCTADMYHRTKMMIAGEMRLLLVESILKWKFKTPV